MDYMNSSIILRLDTVLRELLTSRFREEGNIVYPLDRRASIKDIIESMGIPHTEVGTILSGGKEVSFAHIPTHGEIIDLQALAPGIDVTRPTLLRPEPLPKASFIVDVNVGKLARLLRMAGVDTWYDPALSEAELADTAVRERRVLLSRSRDVLQRKNVVWGHLVRAQQPEEQLAEVISLYGFQDEIKPFTRCMECNTLLEPVKKGDILHRLEPLTIKYYHAFMLCPGCGRVYWKGSHYKRMLKILSGIKVPQVPGDGPGDR
jgi:uncharacterized protein with PIN domain